MLECDVCSKEIAEEDAVTGYSGAGSILCRPCYEYLDNEVFVYKPEEDDGR